MARKRRILQQNGYKVYKHDHLTKVAQDQVGAQAHKIFEDADRGIQTAILSADGAVASVVGLNGTRYLPDPSPDPLDELLRSALVKAAGGK